MRLQFYDIYDGVVLESSSWNDTFVSTCKGLDLLSQGHHLAKLSIHMEIWRDDPAEQTTQYIAALEDLFSSETGLRRSLLKITGLKELEAYVYRDPEHPDGSLIDLENINSICNLESVSIVDKRRLKRAFGGFCELRSLMTSAQERCEKDPPPFSVYTMPAKQ